MCYHDGETTIGEFDGNRLYIRKARRDIGLDSEKPSLNVLSEIDAINKNLSYGTELDAVRLLSWATISPFAGALPWRPSILLTGPSASGKSTIVDMICKQISNAQIFSGGETTEPGVRQRIGNDSCAVIIEESEADTKRKRMNRENLFSMMRQSTSNDAPIAAKGTKDGKGIYFAMRSMFMFVAIDPTIEHVADDNRMFRVNIVKGEPEQSKRFITEWKPRLKQLLNWKTCNGIRSLVWSRLPKILSLATQYADIIQEISGRDSRYSLAEAILYACYACIWRGKSDFNAADASREILRLYNDCPPEEQRCESDELLDLILDHTVQIEKPERLSLTIREVISAVKTGGFSHDLGDDNKPFPNRLTGSEKIYLRNVIGRHGVGITDDNIAIANNSAALMDITGKGRGYGRLLLRHENVTGINKQVKLAGKNRRCLIIGV
jgi:hypothetical protein